MAVDANVLIFERIREEQQKGLGLASAIKNGYQMAFSAIFDSNLTTVLTAVILFEPQWPQTLSPPGSASSVQQTATRLIDHILHR